MDTVMRQWVHTTDIVEHANALPGWQQRYDQLSAGRLDGWLAMTQVDDVQVFRERLNRSAVQSMHLPPQALNILVPLAWPQHDEHADIRALQPMVLPDLDELRVVSPAGMDVLCLSIPLATLACVLDDEVLARLRGSSALQRISVPPARFAADIGQLLVLLDNHHADNAQPAYLKGTSKNVGEAVSAIPMAAPQKQARKRSLRVVNEHSTGLALQPVFNAALTTQVVFRGALKSQLLLLAAGWLETLVNEPRTLPCAGTRRYIVERCHQWLLEQYQEPPSVLELCRRLKVSRRTLQYSFQSVAAVSPVQYLRSVRLNGARRSMRQYPQEGIADIAARWGFEHPSYFSLEYQKLFGELPSFNRRGADGFKTGSGQPRH